MGGETGCLLYLSYGHGLLFVCQLLDIKYSSKLFHGHLSFELIDGVVFEELVDGCVCIYMIIWSVCVGSVLLSFDLVYLRLGFTPGYLCVFHVCVRGEPVVIAE